MHAIEELEDGTAAFYSHRQPAWHRLGTVTDEALTLSEAMKVAQLDWMVYKTDSPVQAAYTVGEDFGLIGVADRYITFRNHPKKGFEGLGVVGKDYTVVQNHEVGELAEAIIDESGAHWETMGSLFGGKKIFMALKLPHGMTVGGEDEHDLYLVLGSSHDGSQAVTAIITDIRVVCQNTWNWALSQAKAKYTFRHTSGVGGRVAEARAALTLAFRYQDDLHREFEKLLARPMLEAEFKNFFVPRLMPMPKEPTAMTVANVEKARAGLSALWNAPTQDFGRGTAYGALMAVTEFDQWVKPAWRKGSEQRKAEALLLGKGSPLAERALALL